MRSDIFYVAGRLLDAVSQQWVLVTVRLGVLEENRYKCYVVSKMQVCTPMIAPRPIYCLCMLHRCKHAEVLT